jgi:hypothetical protein
LLRVIEMHRMACGIIYTAAFAEFLRRKHTAEAGAHPGEILSLEYVRCAEGPHAGSAWWQLVWIPPFQAPAEHQFQIGDIPVYIHRQSRRGLANRLLHFANGEVTVTR